MRHRTHSRQEAISMQEVFPLVVGALIGLAIQRIHAHSLRAIALVVLCLFFGVLASYMSGELAMSWGFISIDTVLVWVGALLASVIVALWRHRASLG